MVKSMLSERRKLMGKSLVYRLNVVTSNYEPKKDCFAYCSEIGCKENPNCHFYKKKGGNSNEN